MLRRFALLALAASLCAACAADGHALNKPIPTTGNDRHVESINAPGAGGVRSN